MYFVGAYLSEVVASPPQTYLSSPTRVYIQGEHWVRIKMDPSLVHLIHAYRFLQKYLLDPIDLYHTEVSVLYVGILV
jgi:hypothetical protein